MAFATFEVDPRLATLLGESYRSTEQAIKELVDNAWDADAEQVNIRLPQHVTLEAIYVEDDGTGMIEGEVRQEYLRVARDRRLSKGDRTPIKRRLVKGRKGIGKFAGLMVADVMTLETRARGVLTTLTIPRGELKSAAQDLERIELPINVVPCEAADHGTKVTLSNLHQNLVFPSPERLKELLVFEYGREDDFWVLVNNERVTMDDIPGESVKQEMTLETAGTVRATFTVTEPKQRGRLPGVVIRVQGKIIGMPSYFGLESSEDIPAVVLKRLYGEIEADGLYDAVAANFGSFIENNKAYQEVREWAQSRIREVLNSTCQREMSLARARLQQDINRRLEKLPEHRRGFAESAIHRIMLRLYNEPEDRVRPLVSVFLDAVERDEYRIVLEKIYQASRSDVSTFADALSDFGLLELGMIAHQAAVRMEFLDLLESLVLNPETTEAVIHKALATNLWVFGSEFGLITSNQTLAKVVEQYTNTKFSGPRANRRPDLFLVSNPSRQYTLIEFKRPSHVIGRQDINQAEQYRDDLTSQFHPIDILVVGGEYDSRINLHPPQHVQLFSYAGVVSRARNELTWLLSDLALPTRA